MNEIRYLLDESVDPLFRAVVELQAVRLFKEE